MAVFLSLCRVVCIFSRRYICLCLCVYVYLLSISAQATNRQQLPSSSMSACKKGSRLMMTVASALPPTAVDLFLFHLVYCRNQTKNNCSSGSHLGRHTSSRVDFLLFLLPLRYGRVKRCLFGKWFCLFNALRHALPIYSDIRTDKFRLCGRQITVLLTALCAACWAELQNGKCNWRWADRIDSAQTALWERAFAPYFCCRCCIDCIECTVI